MKSASPVKTLRHSHEPDKPIQDGLKRRYFCVECEKKFSGWETYFCNVVYDPFRAGTKCPIVYDERLGLFLASAHFRNLVHLDEENPVGDKSGLQSLVNGSRRTRPLVRRRFGGGKQLSIVESRL
jgi:hypothetical protein